LCFHFTIDAKPCQKQNVTQKEYRGESPRFLSSSAAAAAGVIAAAAVACAIVAPNHQNDDEDDDPPPAVAESADTGRSVVAHNDDLLNGLPVSPGSLHSMPPAAFGDGR